MATNREQEILKILSTNPLISQKELAHRLGITRSSVAGHIMNLTDKGYIKGKGYILKEKNYAVTIGGANMDIQGFPAAPLVLKDSNPGTVKLSCGGVGRNIAENLARLGGDVKLLTLLGGDLYAREILETSEAAGVDMNHIKRIPEASSSTYLSILDGDGDMAVAINHMDIINRFDTDYIQSRERLLKNAALIILDANLPEELLYWITDNHRDIPIFADCVSAAKAPRLNSSLSRIHTIKPNRLEAEILSGIRIKSNTDLKRAAEKLITAGIKRVIISLGEEGVFYRSETEEIRMPNLPLPGNPVNATGAGDAFMAGLAYTWMEEYPTVDAIRFALGCSALTMIHEDTINPNISAQKIDQYIKENN